MFCGGEAAGYLKSYSRVVFFDRALKNERMIKVIGRPVSGDSICGHIS
jgi:hypothetical protein